jgi:hypothetical protein
MESHAEFVMFENRPKPRKAYQLHFLALAKVELPRGLCRDGKAFPGF